MSGTPMNPAAAAGRLAGVVWRGVPESPGPAHAFSADRPGEPAFCGAFPHPKDADRPFRRCGSCRATVDRLTAQAKEPAPVPQEATS